MYLGVNGNPRCLGALHDESPRAVRPEDAPSVLCSFVYLRKFREHQPHLRVRSWMLDSGAFSAWRTGTPIDLDVYIRSCQELLATDEKLTEVVALDVIGDWRASLRNAEKMWAAGVPAIPVYHAGEPEDVLRGLARDFPKIGIGVPVWYRPDGRRRFVQQCFTRIWPKPVHGFAVGTRDLVLSAPFHTTDCTSWETGPGSFGRWRSFGGKRLGVRGGDQDLRVELRWYRDLERLARHRWRRDMVVVNDQLRAAGWRGVSDESPPGRENVNVYAGPEGSGG
jgi:hypothetical protein